MPVAVAVQRRQILKAPAVFGGGLQREVTRQLTVSKTLPIPLVELVDVSSLIMRSVIVHGCDRCWHWIPLKRGGVYVRGIRG